LLGFCQRAFLFWERPLLRTRFSTAKLAKWSLIFELGRRVQGQDSSGEEQVGKAHYHYWCDLDHHLSIANQYFCRKVVGSMCNEFQNYILKAIWFWKWGRIFFPFWPRLWLVPTNFSTNFFFFRIWLWLPLYLINTFQFILFFRVGRVRMYKLFITFFSF
jgi:hypothetical protein